MSPFFRGGNFLNQFIKEYVTCPELQRASIMRILLLSRKHYNYDTRILLKVNFFAKNVSDPFDHIEKAANPVLILNT